MTTVEAKRRLRFCWLVFVREEHRSRVAVGLGDDPNLEAGGEAIGGEDTDAVSERPLVELLVLQAKVAPVPGSMAGQERKRGRRVLDWQRLSGP